MPEPRSSRSNLDHVFIITNVSITCCVAQLELLAHSLQLPFQQNTNGTTDPESWKPLKDLIRNVMRPNGNSSRTTGPRDEPRVNVIDTQNGDLRPFATASVKNEEHAKRIFGMSFHNHQINTSA